MLNINELVVRQATNDDCVRIQELVFSVLKEYGLEPDTRATDADISDIEGFYLNSGGNFEIIEDREGDILGTVGLLPIDKTTVELRKMYFDKRLRGLGFGKKTLYRMIENARQNSYQFMFLETASVLIEAIHLYEKAGFAPTNDLHTPRCDRAYKLRL